jgi:hypothetical protein
MWTSVLLYKFKRTVPNIKYNQSGNFSYVKLWETLADMATEMKFKNTNLLKKTNDSEAVSVAEFVYAANLSAEIANRDFAFENLNPSKKPPKIDSQVNGSENKS